MMKPTVVKSGFASMLSAFYPVKATCRQCDMHGRTPPHLRNNPNLPVMRFNDAADDCQAKTTTFGLRGFQITPVPKKLAVYPIDAHSHYA